MDWEWAQDYVTGVNKLRDFSAENKSTWSGSRAILIKYGQSTKYHTAILDPLRA